MPGIARVSIDNAGGTITGSLAPTVKIHDSPVVVYGAEVDSHYEHVSPTMSGHSSTVYANGIQVCRAGDAATCGDIATGNSDVFAG